MAFEFEPDATLCFSFAARPSKFGYTLFNTAFKAAGLNWLYKPVQVETSAQLRDAVAALRGLKVRGCGVSMPWKSEIVPLLDELAPAAKAIGAINTVVNEGGKLVGHNTDAFGAERVLHENGVGAGTEVTLLGAGGVAAALAWALQKLGAMTRIAARRNDARDVLASRFGATGIEWDQRVTGDVVINATPIGMTPDQALSPLDETQLARFNVVADLVASPPESKLIATAKKAGKKVIPGPRFTFEQACRQFELYTGQPPPRAQMLAALDTLVK
jgi:shikimate dehydrogenase